MIPLLIFYIIFSYLFCMGGKMINDEMPWIAVVIAPAAMPVLLGAYFLNANQ